MPDEEMPTGGGVMRGLAAGHTDLGGVFSAIEMVFAPNAYRARQDLEARRRMGQRAPSPADPPDLDPGDGIRHLVYTWRDGRLRASTATDE
jgi:hypothetical protein